MPGKSILTLLTGGDRRSIGRAREVATRVGEDTKLFPQLIKGLWADDEVLRLRAADAVEKVTRARPQLLRRYKKSLLGFMAEERQQEVRWHLAVMIPRLRLNAEERETAMRLLEEYLQDRSSIVKTFALQGMADLARQCPDEEMRRRVVDTLRQAERGGTAAMRARSRKLLREFERVGR
jgi:hypothetical protein